MPSAFVKNSLVFVVLVLSLASLCSAADKKQLEAALAAVEANLKTPAGKQYEERLGTEFPPKYLPSLKQCKQSLPAGESINNFDMFMKLNSNGQVLDVLIYPESWFANCARTALLTGKFSSPPHDNYWVNVHMQLKH
jgi:hypothetical protein